MHGLIHFSFVQNVPIYIGNAHIDVHQNARVGVTKNVFAQLSIYIFCSYHVEHLNRPGGGAGHSRKTVRALGVFKRGPPPPWPSPVSRGTEFAEVQSRCPQTLSATGRIANYLQLPGLTCFCASSSTLAWSLGRSHRSDM